tara:strand:+ start:538 stop:1317 length:780 start_codon:yes stop_codon:yes gene_type:complete
MRKNGGIIGPTNTPDATADDSAASGIWSLAEAKINVQNSKWPTPAPPIVALINYENNWTIGSVGGQTATYDGTSGAWTTSIAKVGSRSLVNGSGDNYITLPYSLQNGGTIEAWFSWSGSQSSGNDRMFELGGDAVENGWSVFRDGSGRFTFRQTGSSGTADAFTDQGSMTGVDVFYHIAYAYDFAPGGSGEFFFNGNRISSAFTTVGNHSLTRLYIGTSSLSGYYFYGSIDAVRVTAGRKLYSGSTYTIPNPATWGLPS